MHSLARRVRLLGKDRIKEEGLRVKEKTRKMKDSGVEWIGEVPEEWMVFPLGIFFDERKEKVSDLNFEPLSVTKKGIVKQLDDAAKSNSHDNRKKVCKGDFVINSRSDRKQSCGLSAFEGSVSVINIVLKNKALNSGFVKYLLDNYGFAEEFYRWGTGIVDDLWSTRFDKMKRIMLPYPSTEEQYAIGKFLDSKVSLIDETIEKTKKSIEDYKKYKQSLITETVTKGLNPDVEMKDSGIEWIGEIPKHWDVVKLKHTSWIKGRIGWQGLRSSEFAEIGPYLITGTDFQNGEINWETCVHISKERYNEAPEIHITEGDLLITKDGTIGKVAIAKNCPDKVSLNSGVFLIRNTKNTKCENKYLYYVLLSNIFWKWFNSSLTGNSTIIHLYQEQFYNFSYALPNVKEQKQIADYLDNKCSQIDKVIEQKETVINELEMYKKSLIYEYVTGKKRVGMQE